MLEIPPNEGLYEELQKLKAENYRLANTLRKRNNEAKGRDKYIRKLEKELKEFRKNRKPHFKNGKRGTIKNGG